MALAAHGALLSCLQIERIANEEVSGLQVPGISSIAKSTKRAAKQITVRMCCQ